MTAAKRTVFFVLFFCFFFPMHLRAESESVQGIYSLMKGMRPVDPSVLKIKYVKGVSIRASWAEIEPEEGKFNWDYLDRALEEVRKEGKKAMLRILPGVHTPEWVYKKGAELLEIGASRPRRRAFVKEEGSVDKSKDRGGREGGAMRARSAGTPVPWDNKYLNDWIRFITALGKRYGSEAAVSLVHMAGPTVNSAEMHLPKRGEAKGFMDAHYRKDKVVDAWKRVIDAYKKAFPEKALALNIAIPFRNDGALEEVVQYGMMKLGKAFCVQGNWLSARTMESFHPYKLLSDFGKKGSARVGFQMLAPSANEARQGSLEVSIRKGLDAGARYFEIYEADIKEEQNKKLLEDLEKKLK